MIQSRQSESCHTVDSFSEQLVSKSKRIIDGGKNIEAPTLLADTFTQRAKIFWKTQFTEIAFGLDWAECGWLLYAIAGIEGTFDYVQTVFNAKALPATFRYVNQCPCGMVALQLYKRTNDITYKLYADKMFSGLLMQDTDFGILYREHDRYALVDVVGMAIPFLLYYGHVFNNKEAISLANKTVEKYIEFGCDSMTGIPVFEFGVNPPYIKSGAADWGRGIAWFVIGLTYIDELQLCENSQKMINKMNASLLDIWKRYGSFGQFVGRGGRDLSAELPILYYMYRKDMVNLNEADILSYSRLCYDGIMYHSSAGNHGLIKYGTPFGPNVLSQAYMLRLITLFNMKCGIDGKFDKTDWLY